MAGIATTGTDNSGKLVKQGYLSEYFEGVAAKNLTAVEADPGRSNGHEYNATADMLNFMGRPTDATRLPTRFLYFSDQAAHPVVDDAYLTLYDSRKNNPQRASEYRFYFQSTAVSQATAEGDLLILGKLGTGQILVVVAEKASSVATQLLWLFGFKTLKQNGFAVRNELDHESDRIGYAARSILEFIGIEVAEQESESENQLASMLGAFGRKFPTTIEFSEFARSTVANVSPADDPDAALLAWMEREEILFKTLERELVAERLKEGFVGDVDGFLQFSLSVQNRRKSRSGAALENHLCEIFSACEIQYCRTAVTENRSKPDFLFPGIVEYKRLEYPPDRLTMLGVKTTCKDRWRQVLSEAARIDQKHLLTLEAAISANQTEEMQAHKLQLVVPRELQSTYSSEQQKWLLSLRAFIELVAARQG